MKKFTVLFRILWLFAILMIIATDYVRDPKYIVDNGSYHYTYLLISTILFLLLLTVITVIRALESRNEWRDMIKEGDVEAMEGLSYRKRVEKEMDEDGIK